ncbi:phosphohydrolase [Brachybacterium vulturis]|uniref:Phosphohydrolase n=1 Tax=Brachybacterium vulturis TaxID=2017484 RepID=A0A291GP80_9MICO|nr:HD domain-containing protein [Brachybacterium vulturis]ATG52041.1 phosphohydrolase [Brachybacterium vulturis]
MMDVPGRQTGQECPIRHGDRPGSVGRGASDAARALMHSHLRDLPRRRAHSEGVARAMNDLYASAHPTVRVVAIAAGLVHDIGYGTVRTGLHSLDGATALEGTPLQFLAPLVAWHSTAAQESATRGIPIEVPQPEDPRMRAALWIADFSTSPTGRPIAPVDRIVDIRERYAPDSPVIAALDAGMADFIAALRLWGRHGEADAVGAADT